MNINISFVLNSLLLGIGLAMDAFSVSLADGLKEPKMKIKRMCGIAGTFGGFQALMPMAGWICVHTIIQIFQSLQKLVPWIALILLVYIGGKMVIEGIQNKQKPEELYELTPAILFVQGIATSIDALSVGFTIANLNWSMALICSVIIAATTFVICMAGLGIGKKLGTSLTGKASVLGGAILIAIGIEIFISNIKL